MIRPSALLAALALLATSLPAEAKPKKKKPDAAAPAAAEEAAAPAPAGPTPEQIQAGEEFKKGQELEQAGDLDGAIAQYEKAFGLYADPELQFLLGETHRKKGDQTSDFAEYEKAIPCFEKYLEMAPEGRAAEAAKQRITALQQGIENEKARKAKEEETKKIEEADEAKAKAQAEAEEKAKREAAEGMQLALDVSLTAGSEPDFTGILRMVGGGLLGWGGFAFEGHLGFAGFLRTGSGGVAARELTALDLGMRYGFDGNRFVGPWVGAGGSFGFLSGKPRERRLVDDEPTCGGGDCTISIDKDITSRLTFGYGFKSSDKTTVAFRVDLSYMMFSVDDEQATVPASRVDKPQGFVAALVGLEFMHWP
jgi:hypothetical protein